MKQSSIGLKIQKYLIVFVVAIIAMFWIFQVLLLDPFYRYIKIREVKSLADRIKNQEVIDLDQEAFDSNSYLQLVDYNGSVLEQYALGVTNERVPQFSSLQLAYIFSSLEDDGLVLENAEADTDRSFIAYAAKLDEQRMIVIVTQILPVNATVNTIKVQLIASTVILVVLSVLLTRIIYKKISKPIMNLNEEAKVLTQGNYTRPFTGTGYKEIEELSDTLNKMRQDLSRVEALRNELISNVSHDLRTPLTMIGGYAEMMRDIPGEMSEKNLDVILDETKHLSVLVQDMLDLSSIQSGMQKLDATVFDMHELIVKVKERLSHNYPDRDIIVQDEVSVKVLGDQVKLEQVLYNLINNALIHTEGTVNILTHSEGTDLEVGIQDEGPGMDEQTQEYIWNRYYQSNLDHQRKGVGSGLGLSIVKNILDLHHVTYGVRSDVESGSYFWFRIPVSGHDQ